MTERVLRLQATVARSRVTVPALATELYAEIATYLANRELRSLAAASVMLCAVAYRVLYTRIELGDGATRKTVVRLMQTLRANKALVDLPRHLAVHWVRLRGEEPPSLQAAFLADVLPTLTSLTYFSVSESLGIFTWAFDNVVMPSLTQFHSYATGLVSTKFLANHPRLTHLTLCQSQPSRPAPMPSFEELVYLRVTHGGVAEEMFKRLKQPSTLERVVFGRYVSAKRIMSALALCPAPLPHVDMLEEFDKSGMAQQIPGEFSTVALGVTSVGVTMCHLFPDYTVAYGPTLDGAIAAALASIASRFPNLTTLRVYCSDQSHRHQDMASFAFLKVIDVLRTQTHSLENVCISEFWGSPVLAVCRNGQWQWACVPEDSRDPGSYQTIAWPQC